MKKQNQKSSASLSWGMVLLGVFVFVVLAMMATPVVMKSCKKAASTTAVSNAKQIFYLMVEFDGDYCEFPSDTSAIVHRGADGEVDVDLSSLKGEYSNDYMRQFFAGGYTSSEEIFVSPWEKGSGRKADNVISPRERILEAGECNFSYVKNQSTSDNSGRPILLSPMTGEGFAFDPEVYNGKALMLRIDGAVKQLLIDKKSHLAKIGEGKTLFEGGQDTVWGVEGFDPAKLVHPKPWPHQRKDSLVIVISSVVAVLLVFVIVCIKRSRRKQRRSHAKN